jgi:hypothetical protein
VKNRFQNLPFKFNLQRYTEGAASATPPTTTQRTLSPGAGGGGGGMLRGEILESLEK